MDIHDSGVIRAALVTPLGIAENGAVIVNDLPAYPNADRTGLQSTQFDIGLLEVPLYLVRRTHGRLEKHGACVLELGEQPQPTGRLEAHAEAEAVEKIGIVGVELETAAAGAFPPKTLFEAELDPRGQLFVQLGDRSEIGRVIRARIGRRRGAVATQGTQNSVRHRSSQHLRFLRGLGNGARSISRRQSFLD